jgi:hypothetical protein
LGWLFRTTSKTTEKSNLLVFITPKVVKHVDRLAEIKQEALLQRDEFISTHKGGEEPFPKVRSQLGGSITPPQNTSGFSPSNQNNPFGSSPDVELNTQEPSTNLNSVPPNSLTPPVDNQARGSDTILSPEAEFNLDNELKEIESLDDGSASEEALPEF